MLNRENGVFLYLTHTKVTGVNNLLHLSTDVFQDKINR